jgi:ASCH domain
MKALTIRQPWAHAILHLGKDAENRSWRTHYRGLLLIHAAAYHERHPREQLAQYMRRPPSAKSLIDLPTGYIVGVVEVVGCVRNSRSRWAERGGWHWLLKNPRPIKPVKCNGRLMLWTPSRSVMKGLPAWVRKLD